MRFMALVTIGAIGALSTIASANEARRPGVDIRPTSSAVQAARPCPAGYHTDGLGRCVRNPVRHNHQWHYQPPHAGPGAPSNAPIPHAARGPSHAPAAPAHAPATAPVPAAPPPPTAGEPISPVEGEPAGPPGPKILETGYEVLPTAEAEKPGYGLYSYAILTSQSERSSAFLEQVFTNIRSIGGIAATPIQTNIFYIPIQADKQGVLETIVKPSVSANLVARDFVQKFYDFKIAQGILDHLCSKPPKFMQDVCAGDLSGGPYILTYPHPIGKDVEVAPPYLFFDLTNLNERAFAELIASFKARVKGDLNDDTRLISFRLKVLSITLTAADWINPVRAAVADIIHSDTPSPTKRSRSP
jgi:hypothetical protein